MGALFVAALVWRLLYLGRLAAGPLAGSLRSDERIYWDWATWLIDHHFLGTNPFFLGPLYPYFIALARVLTGSGVLSVLSIQAVLGAMAVVLLADTARQLSRPLVALAFGAIMAFYEMSVFFDGLVLMESLLFFLECVLLWLWCRALRPQAGSRTMGAIGLLTGLVAQCRATGALLLIPGVWIAMRGSGRSLRASYRQLILVVGAFVLTTLPTLAWNWRTAHEFIPFTYNLGYNLFVGNNPDANGGFVWIAGGERLGALGEVRADGGGEMDGRDHIERAHGLKLSPAQSSLYWSRQAMEFISSDPQRALTLVGRKLLLLWNRRETPQIENPEEYRRLAGPLGLPVVGAFGFIGATGLAGMLCASGPPVLALRMYVAALTLGTLPFFVTDRYRWHLVPALMLLAAGAVEAFLVHWRSRPRRGVWRFVAAATCALAIVALPSLGGDRVVDEWRMARDLAMRELEQGQRELAIRDFERAIQLDQSLGSGADQDPEMTKDRALLHFNYGVALHRAGREDDALRWLRIAAEGDPKNPRFVRTLADAYMAHGLVREGDSLFRLVGDLDEGAGQLQLSQGWRAAREGRLQDAEEQFRRAVTASPRLYGAWGALIRVQVQRGELTAAESTLEQARQMGMPTIVLAAHRALVYAGLGDSAGAQRELDQIPESSLAGDPLLAGVVASARHKLISRHRP